MRFEQSGLGRVTSNRSELVIFDCDGVLVDSEPISIAVLLAIIAEVGGDITEADRL